MTRKQPIRKTESKQNKEWLECTLTNAGLQEKGEQFFTRPLRESELQSDLFDDEEDEDNG